MSKVRTAEELTAYEAGVNTGLIMANGIAVDRMHDLVTTGLDVPEDLILVSGSIVDILRERIEQSK